MSIKVKELREQMNQTLDLIHKVHPGLAAHIASNNKNFGDNSLYWFKQDAEEAQYDAWSTGRFMIDNILGNRGFVRGRIIEVYGGESSGKTTLCLDLAAESQLIGGIDEYVDAEHTLDHQLARNVGVSREFMLFSQPDSGEQGLNIINHAAKSGVVSNVYVDSVDGLVPKCILEGEVGDVTVGAAARMMSQGLRLINKSCSLSGANVFFVNQIRDKIQTGFGGGFGPKTTTGGGRALKFYASYRIEMTKIGQIKSSPKDGGDIIGQVVKLKLVKNKTSPPHRECDVELYFWEKEGLWGFNKSADMFNTAMMLGLINASGVRVYDKRIKLANGKLNSILELHNDPDKFNAVRQDLKRRLGYDRDFVFNKELVGKLFVVPDNINSFAMNNAVDDEAPLVVVDEESDDPKKSAMMNKLKSAFHGLSEEEIQAILANSQEIKTVKVEDEQQIEFANPTPMKVSLPDDPFEITDEEEEPENESEENSEASASPEDFALAPQASDTPNSNPFDSAEFDFQ